MNIDDKMDAFIKKSENIIAEIEKILEQLKQLNCIKNK